MSRYGMDAALWHIYTSAENSQLFLRDPDLYLAQFSLTEAEFRAIAEQDRAALLDLGAHPFLMYKMALRIAGGFSMEFLQGYLGPIEGKSLGDIVT